VSRLPEQTYRIGPLAITAAMAPGPAADVIDATLGLYDVRWPAETVDRTVRLEVTETPVPGPAPVVGDYLEAASMLVDGTAEGLRAATLGGATARADFLPDGESWRIGIPPALATGRRTWEIEDVLSLVLTTGWRRGGWVPLHGAGLTRDGRGLLCVATSGGGKTTFTVSLIRRGWRALGDDKILLSTAAGDPRMVGLLQTLNLDPAVSAWFPEVGSLAEVAPYSEGSAKRRQTIEGRWPGGTALEMTATDLLVLDRTDARCGIIATPLATSDVVAALLRQTVVPSDRTVGAMIVRTLGALAVSLRGWHVAVGQDAYEGPDPLDRLGATLGWR
jgi:hypothetical protein